MKDIVYLFGAGASKECLPIVNEIPGRIKDLIAYLQDLESLVDNKTAHLALINDLNWLLSESSRHASVDTYAKKLYLRNDSLGLNRLKISLSVFLTIEQIRNRPDMRYDAFYAAILDEITLRLPKSINIVSWNYDQQFELALFEYTGDPRLEACSATLQTIHKNKEARRNNPGSCFYRLNGSAGLRMNGEIYSFAAENNFQFDYRCYKKILTTYSDLKLQKQSSRPALSFAWERESIENGVIELADKCMQKAEVLVVIGYSFPVFNREVDRRVIGGAAKLKKIYIQCPDAEDVIERFKAIRFDSNLEIVPHHDTKQFLIPIEI